jgi:hypothetical protein
MPCTDTQQMARLPGLVMTQGQYGEDRVVPEDGLCKVRIFAREREKMTQQDKCRIIFPR